MTILGYILLVLGLVVWVYGAVRFLALAYNQGLWWFFGCLFVPFVDLAFLVVHFRNAVKPFGLALLGIAVGGFGAWAAGMH